VRTPGSLPEICATGGIDEVAATGTVSCSLLVGAFGGMAVKTIAIRAANGSGLNRSDFRASRRTDGRRADRWNFDDEIRHI